MDVRIRAIVAALFIVGPVGACSICAGMTGRPSLRQETVNARHVYFGTLSNPRLNVVTAAGASNTSATDFTVEQVIKSDSASRRSQKQITIPRYVPVDAKALPKYLVFCDERDGTLDPYRGTPVKSKELVTYLKLATAIDPGNEDSILEHAGKYLASEDADVAAEAFLEFARSSDPAVLRAAKKLDRVVLRKLLDDEKTPQERLGLFAYLLGASGDAADARHLSAILQNPGDRFRPALSGLYAGLVMMQPTEGWKHIHAVLADPGKPFPARNSALSALRFCFNADPQSYRSQMLAGAKSLLSQGDIADLVIEDLRRWKVWDLSQEVFQLYQLKTHDAPLMRRAIIRYGLSCPSDEAREFVRKVRMIEAVVVREVEESLEFEKVAAP